MSTQVSSLAVQLTASSGGMVAELKKGEAAVDSFANKIKQGFHLGLGMLGVEAGASALKEMAHWAGEAFEANERAQKSFKLLLRNADDARQLMVNLNSLSFSTGLEQNLTRTAASQLLKFGFAKEDIEPILKVLGDVGADAVEGMNASMMQNIQLFGVIRDQGTLTSKNLKAFAAQGIEPWDALSKAMGKTKAELREMLEAGTIDASTGIIAILNAMQDKFGGRLKEDLGEVSTKLRQVSEAAKNMVADFVEGGKIIGEDLLTRGEILAYMISHGVGNDTAIFELEQQKQIEKTNKLHLESLRLAQEKENFDKRRIQALHDEAKAMSDKQDEAIKFFGKSPDEIAIEKLAEKGGDPTWVNLLRFGNEQLKQMQANAEAVKKAEEDRLALMREGQRLAQEVLTPGEKYRAELEKINKLLAEGVISEETAIRAREKAKPVNDVELERQREIDQLHQQAQQAMEAQLEPATKLRQEFEKAQQAFLAGNLSAEEFAGLASKAQKDFAGANKKDRDELRFSGAAVAGSQEAFSAIAKATVGTTTRDDNMKKAVEEAVKQTQLQKQTLDAVKKNAVGDQLANIKTIQY